MLLYPENGGCGMLFHDKDGQLSFTLHDPTNTSSARIFCGRSRQTGRSVCFRIGQKRTPCPPHPTASEEEKGQNEI